MADRQPRMRHSRGDRAPMSVRERLVAGFGLTLAILSAGGDGYLTADQMAPFWLWLCNHLPSLFHTGLLAGLAGHWPSPRLVWPFWQWAGVGLLTAFVGKGALLPIQRRAAMLGKRSLLGLNLFLLMVSLSGVLAIFLG